MNTRKQLWMYAMMFFGALLIMTTSCDKDDDPEPDSNTKSYSKEDLAGEWRTSASNYWYYVLNVDGTAEMGQYSSVMGEVTASDENASWEIKDITLDEVNMETGELEEKTLAGVVVTDSEGYYYELEIKEVNDSTFQLMDHDNTERYALYTAGNNTGGDGDDDGNGGESPSAAYEVDDVYGEWEASNQYLILKKDGTGEEGSVSRITGREKEGDITWEIMDITDDVVDMQTGEISEVTLAGVKVNTSDGYYRELEIQEVEDTIELKDLDNNWRYKRLPDERDEVLVVSDLPGKIETEDYMTGGEGEGYHDETEGQEYDCEYRMGSVDMSKDYSRSNNHYLRSIEPGEWLDYKVNVAEAGIYKIMVNYATGGDEGLDVSINWGSYSDKVNLASTGGWSTFETITLSKYIYLNAGSNQLRMEFSGSGASDVDYIEVAGASNEYSYDDFYGLRFESEDGRDYVDFGTSEALRISGSGNQFHEDHVEFVMLEVEVDYSTSYYTPGVIISPFSSKWVFEIKSGDKLVYLGDEDRLSENADGTQKMRLDDYTIDLTNTEAAPSGGDDDNTGGDDGSSGDTFSLYPSTWEFESSFLGTCRIVISSANDITYYTGYGGSYQTQTAWTCEFDATTMKGTFYDNGEDIGGFAVSSDGNTLTWEDDDYSKK